NRIAGLMITASDFMNRPDARIIFYPASYSALKTKLREQENQVMQLLEEIARETDPKAREEKKTRLRELYTQIAALRAEIQVDSLQETRDRAKARRDDAILAIAAANSASDEINSDLLEQAREANEAVVAIDEQLAQLIR